MSRIIVAGIGTGVGKTLVSAILTTLLKGDYWKPIQTGDPASSDSNEIARLVDNAHIHPSAYSFSAPLSPHHAARLEQRVIDLKNIVLPATPRPLIIESVGGLMVPLTTTLLTFRLFKGWGPCRWVVVSRHYLGSINHTLLTIAALKSAKIPISGLIFNGEPNPDSEAAILEITQLPLLGRLLPEKEFNKKTTQRYAEAWKVNCSQLIH